MTIYIWSVALQPWRAKTDCSGCCQMAVQEALWLEKRLSFNLNLTFLNRISLPLIPSSYPSSWVDPVPDPILAEKFLGYSRKTNPGPLRWQSDMLTTIPNRRDFEQFFKQIFSFSVCFSFSYSNIPLKAARIPPKSHARTTGGRRTHTTVWKPL